MKTYIIEGGIGKHVMFTALIEGLARNTKEGVINVVSPYSDVFIHNEYVANSWRLDHPADSDKMKEVTTDLIHYEPYKSMFQLNKEGHLLDYWAKGLGLTAEDIASKPTLNVLDKPILDMVDEVVDDIGGDFIVVQFTGGQSPLDFDPDNSQYHLGPMHVQRNYPEAFARTLIKKINKKYPNLTIIDYSLPNEHSGYEGTERVQLPYVGYVELLKKAKTHIAIDSSLLHFGAAAGVNGIGLYGGIPYWQFGWDSITPITNFKGDIKDFDENDPYYISINSDTIVEELDKYMAKI